MEKFPNNPAPESKLENEIVGLVDQAIDRVVHDKVEIIRTLRERRGDAELDSLGFAEAFTSNFKFEVAGLVEQYGKYAAADQNKVDEIIIKRLKERAGDF